MNAALPRLKATRPLRWSQCPITFSSVDQLKCAATASALPMLCSPVISNVQVTKTLIERDSTSYLSTRSTTSKCHMSIFSLPSLSQE
mgnify:CR=1 FL=1